MHRKEEKKSTALCALMLKDKGMQRNARGPLAYIWQVINSQSVTTKRLDCAKEYAADTRYQQNKE
jgi:hypothetical protein